jgi:signal transduction histidine kinase
MLRLYPRVSFYQVLLREPYLSTPHRWCFHKAHRTYCKRASHVQYGVRAVQCRLSSLLLSQLSLPRQIPLPTSTYPTRVVLSVVADEVSRNVKRSRTRQRRAADGDYEAKSRNCAVVFDAPAECWIEGAPETLRGAIENVVRNAVQYTREGTNIEIRVDRLPGLARSGQRAVIQVRDHGQGVPEDALADLFVPFYRIHQSNNNSNGIGLGLAIAERTFRLHGGKVAAANAPNGGLIVTLELPLLVSNDQFAEMTVGSAGKRLDLHVGPAPLR